MAQIQGQALATEVVVNVTDDEAENEKNTSSDVATSKSRIRSRSELRPSLPVTPGHSLRSSSPVAPLPKKAKSHNRSSSPIARSSSSPIAPLPKLHKRSHAEFRSSSPVAHSLRSSRSSSPVAPLKKKAKTGQEVIHKDQPIIPVYREGAEINHKKPKASDYNDIVQALILRAASQYEASVSTQDSFPDTTQRLKWARKSWSDANDDAGHEYEITDEISSLVCLSYYLILLIILVILLFL